MPNPPRTKIAILGGGMAALAAAFELTSQPGWQERYEITIYQMGWRLGGKGASGCNAAIYDRIEEHGMHFWLGFYENAFHLIRHCYAELGRAADQPLATWEAAFHPYDLVICHENLEGDWHPWVWSFPRNRHRPGDGAPAPSGKELARRLLPHAFASWRAMQRLAHDPVPRPGATVLRRGAELGAALSLLGAKGASLCGVPARGRLEQAIERCLARVAGARRLWIGTDLALTIIRGIVTDRLLERGFDTIDDQDYREWLKQHGASALLLASGVVRTLYDQLFAYEDGDLARPRLAAGVALRVTLRMLLGYKGALYYMMQSGMGETVFAPLYLVLRRRGVRFAFFHRVDQLGLSADQRAVGSIRLARQCTLASDDYDPLVAIDGLPCWPSVPRYEQIVEGPELAARAVDLESAWSDWRDVHEYTLERGRDFDLVVLGISIAALPRICGELAAAHPPWRAMFTHVKTVRTQALQLWLRPTPAQLGWTLPPAVSMSGPAHHCSEADFSHLLQREHWPADRRPGALAYCCGVMLDSSEPPATDTTFPARMRAQAQANAREWLAGHAQCFWPQLRSPGPARAFDWTMLMHDRANGDEQLEAQYVRANINPSDRYVQSLPGSTRYRLRPDESGFENLYLAGDWVRNGFNAGMIEGAVIAGRQVARAITGVPCCIPGEHDL